MTRKALIVVDIQNDFLPGGALAVKNGDEIIPLVNSLMDHFDLIVATQDWHPANHQSFASNHLNRVPGDQIVLEGVEQILWPVHCVQNTSGADFSRNLHINHFDKVFQKGMNIHVDSYSGFFDNGKRQNTGLYNFLKKNKADEVYIVGLATDYCVKYTALDAFGLGLKTNVIIDATRAVNLKDGDFEKSEEEMRAKGINLVTVQEILSKKNARKYPPGHINYL